MAMALISACLHTKVPPPLPGKAVLQVWREVPAQVFVGETFTVRLTIRVERTLPAVLVKELFPGLTLVDAGSGFTIAQEDTLKGVILEPSAGTTKTFSYRVRCPKPMPYTIVGEVSTKGLDPVVTISTLTCAERK